MKNAKEEIEDEVVEEAVGLEILNLWLQLGIDLEKRRIHLDTTVDEGMASVIYRGLKKLEDISNDPIDIYICTPGGSAYHALGIYDAIRTCKAKVRMHAYGYVCSAGPIIFLAGEERYAAPNTSFMVHSIWYAPSEAKVKDHEIDVVEGKRMNGKAQDILAERTKMNKKFWYRSMTSGDKWFDVNQAKDWGFLKSVPEMKKKTVVKKVRGKK